MNFSSKSLFNDCFSAILAKNAQISTNEIQTIAYYFLEEIFDLKKLDILLDKKITLEENIFLEKNQMLANFMERIAQNEPLQHILGYTFFDNLRIKTSKNALIPRPETEELMFLIQNSFPKNSNFQIADICTGTGCIGLSLANFFKNAVVFATDISLKALELAKENKILNNIQNINFFEQDILKDITLENTISKNNAFNQKLDIIVSNPPYICEYEKKDMQKNVLDFEPHLALFVENENPLIFYEKILIFAQNFLKDDGHIFFEINESFGNEMISLSKKHNFQNIILHKDFREKDRFLVIRNQ